MVSFTISADELDAAVGAFGRLSVLDKKLLKWAAERRSPEWMSAKLDGVLSPAAAAQRTREILKSQDWLSQVEQRALILQDMIELKNILMGRIRKEGGLVTDEETGQVAYSFGDPRWAANLTKLLGEMNKLIINEQSQVDVERQSLRRAHAQVMVRAVELAFKTLVLRVREKYPEVDEMVLRTFLEDALPNAVSAIEMSVAVEEREDGF